MLRIDTEYNTIIRLIALKPVASLEADGNWPCHNASGYVNFQGYRKVYLSKPEDDQEDGSKDSQKGGQESEWEDDWKDGCEDGQKSTCALRQLEDYKTTYNDAQESPTRLERGGTSCV